MASLLFCLLLLLAMVAKEVQSQTSFGINAFTPHSQLLTYERDAFVPSDATNVRLTRVNGSGFPLMNSVGRVLFRNPVRLWDTNRQASFDTTITLQISSTNVSAGDGMTFFIIPVNSTISTGGNGHNLGIYNAVVPCSPILAVEFDIAVGPSDPNFRHIGININSQRSQNHTRADNIIGQRVTARITYNAPTRRINVVATYGSTTATVSFVYNLRALFPADVQVGISAATGGFVANHDAYRWHFNSTLVTDVNRVIGDDAYIKQYVM